MTRPFSHSVPQAGFTLLEMSIVLTVIGLIAGSIIVVRDLIRNSEVQSVINDEDRYKNAIQLFKEKYNYLPGDMPTATNFWGAEASCPTAYSAGEAVPKTMTCNGDGNGMIDTFPEAMRAWQQLANAGFIQGSYSGIQGNANANSLGVGTDIPASKVPGCGWMMGFIQSVNLSLGAGNVPFPAGTRLALLAGGADNNFPPCLTPIESYGIDTKIDDGIPYSGNVIDGFPPLQALVSWNEWGATGAIMTNHFTSWPSCTTGGATPPQYNTSSSAIYCDPFFNTGL